MKGRAKSYNEVLNLFRSVSVDYDADKIKNPDKSCDLSCLVDQTPKISNLLEDIKKVGRFVQYVENHEGDGDDT